MKPKISVKRWIKQGVEVWVLRYHEFGKVKHRFFGSEAAADGEATRLQKQVERTGQVRNSLTASEREGVNPFSIFHNAWKFQPFTWSKTGHVNNSRIRENTEVIQ